MFIALVLTMNLTHIMGLLSQARCLKDLWVKYHQTGLACSYSDP